MRDKSSNFSYFFCNPNHTAETVPIARGLGLYPLHTEWKTPLKPMVIKLLSSLTPPLL